MNALIIKLTSPPMAAAAAASSRPPCCRNCWPIQPIAAVQQLLVGTETGDDAVWQVDDNTCIVATPTSSCRWPTTYDFGRIAATNAISDASAMGAKPIMALAILGMPLDKISTDVVREILQGRRVGVRRRRHSGRRRHSIDAPEPIYGLVAIASAGPNRCAAMPTRAGRCADPDQGTRRRHLLRCHQERRTRRRRYAEMVASTTLLNRIGGELSANPAVHAITDVTGFGLLGHGLELARGSNPPR